MLLLSSYVHHCIIYITVPSAQITILQYNMNQVREIHSSYPVVRLDVLVPPVHHHLQQGSVHLLYLSCLITGIVMCLVSQAGLSSVHVKILHPSWSIYTVGLTTSGTLHVE